MALHKNLNFLLILILMLIQNIIVLRLHATPLNNNADSNPIYNTAGTDKFYKKLPKTMLLSLDISPYYQSAKGCRNWNGVKVPTGEMFGRWNMLSVFFDTAKMTPKTFSKTNYPNLWTTNTLLKNIDGVDYTDTSNYYPYSADTTGATATFDNTSLYQVSGEYEKIGLRGKLGFDTKMGLGLSIKSGVADYKIRPTLTAVASTVTTPPTIQPAATFYKDLLIQTPRDGIFKDIELDAGEVRNTEMEDTHAQIYWSIPFNIKEDDEVVATIAPYLAVGGWLSSGNKKDYTKAFDMSTGNNGHSGITAEGAFNFDFSGTVQLGIGGGVLWLDDEDIDTYRFASNIYQSGFYPWTTKVKIDPGLTWCFNASFKSENFMSVMPGFAIFFDYIYTYHEHDDITIQDTSTQRTALFNTGMEIMKKNSGWKSQLIDLGINYEVVKHLTLGFIVQAPISGTNTYRSVTTMGTVTISF